MQNLILIQNAEGKPLKPSKRHKHTRDLLKEGKAVVVCYKPYTVRLLYNSTQNTTVTYGASDFGRTNFGFAVVEDNATPLYSSKLESRNKEVPKLMKERNGHRRASRSGERKVRQRKAKRNNTCFKDAKFHQRILPQCEKPITVNYINNTEAKFCNRKRPEGWTTPTVNHLIETYLNAIRDLKKRVPITYFVFEVNKFVFMLMENPNIKGWQYQKGRLYGYDSVDDAVCDAQNGKCLFCDHEIEEYHHIVERSEGGSDTFANKVGLCNHHHDLVHKHSEWKEKLKSKKEGILKEYGALSVINQVMPYVISELQKEFSDNLILCGGSDTADMREKYNIPKDHDLDAYAMALWAIEQHGKKIDPDKVVKELCSYQICQFRRHNRQNIHRQTERTYKYNGKVVAKNRCKRTGQTKCDSLHEWYIKTKHKFGLKETKKMQSQLKVLKSKRSYRNPDLIEPGTVVLYNGKRHVVSGNKNNGQYLLFKDTGSSYFKTKDCAILSYNKGLVYL